MASVRYCGATAFGTTGSKAVLGWPMSVLSSKSHTSTCHCTVVRCDEATMLETLFKTGELAVGQSGAEPFGNSIIVLVSRMIDDCGVTIRCA